MPAFGDLCVTPPVGDSVAEMASISSGEPPILDSRLRGNDGCAKVSLRGNDGGATVSLRGHDGRVCLRPGVERSRHSGPQAGIQGWGSSSSTAQLLPRPNTTAEVLPRSPKVGDECPFRPLDARLRGHDGCSKVSLRGNDGGATVSLRGHDGRVCLRPGVEHSRHSGP